MSFKKMWDSLVTPAAALTGIDRQKALILSAMLIVFIPLAFLTVFGNAILTFFTGQVPATVSPGAAAAFVLVVVAYGISRTQHYKFSALLMMAVPYVAVIAVAANSGTTSVISLFFLSLGVILASLLFTARETVALGIFTVIVIVVLTSFAPVNPPIASPIPILGYVAICAGLTALVSNFRDRYMSQLEQAQEQLRQQIVVIDQARAQAERSDSVKSAFLASMSHELRTPLNSIINFTKFLERGIMGEVNDQQTETLREIIDNSEHLLSLINDILDMSKIESGSLKLFIEENVDINDILNTTVSTARSLLGEKKVELKVNIDDNLPKMTADRQRLLQIMLNIISNACKFTAKGEIEIKAQVKNDQIHVSVRDTGPGIPEEDRDEVFASFKQTKSGLRQGGGTGLGMPISRNLAEAHEGKLWFESVVDQGTTFFVTLPVKSKTLVPTL